MLIENILRHLVTTLTQQGFKTLVHFELEGVVQLRPDKKALEYNGINQALRQLGIDGELKTEYWKNQWEYVSLFNGQSPLKEAQNLAKALKVLPRLLRQFGAKQVLIQPVAWGADNGRYVDGSGAIFSLDKRSVHIPNAIQMNVSVENENGENLFAQQGLGEWVQQQFLENSYRNCILFLPEEDAFKRLALRQDYDLDAELSSPVILSGGHQGSIALYKEIGKHNQAMGLEPLFYAADDSVLHYTGDWRKTARVEHRIGATSKKYNPFLNMLFVLLNVLEGIKYWKTGQLPPKFPDKALPISLVDIVSNSDKNTQFGAISLFENDNWLSDRIDHYCHDMAGVDIENLGQRVKALALKPYLNSEIVTES